MTVALHEDRRQAVLVSMLVASAVDAFQYGIGALVPRMNLIRPAAGLAPLLTEE